jgi:hypothetical protein
LTIENSWNHNFHHLRIPINPSELKLEDPSENPLMDQVEIYESNASLVLKDAQPAMQVGSSNDVDDACSLGYLEPSNKFKFNKLSWT